MTMIYPVVYVVYKKKSGSTWRGFCVPYDVTCVADSANDAKKKLESLVKLYEKGLEKYKYPRHLVFKKLSEKDDRSVFSNKVWPKVGPEISQHMKKLLESTTTSSTPKNIVISESIKSSISFPVPSRELVPQC